MSQSNQKKDTKKITKEDQIKTKEDIKITKELMDYAKNPDVGINWEIPEAFANGHKFKINPFGHLKKNKDKIRVIQKKFNEKIQDTVEDFDVLVANDLNEEASRQILAIGLETIDQKTKEVIPFDYESWANHIDVGPTVLEQMANEVATFLVVQGGKAGFKHWEMQQKLAMQTLLTR